MNGTHTGGGAYSVASGATLGGKGTIASATSINAGGIHSAAATLGTAADVQKFTGNLTYADSSIFSWEIAKTNAASQTRGIDYDAVNVTGTLAGLDGADAGTATDAIFRIVIGDANFSDTFWNADRTWGDIFTSADGSTDKTNWASIFGGGFQYYKTDGTVLGTPTDGRQLQLRGLRHRTEMDRRARAHQRAGRAPDHRRPAAPPPQRVMIFRS